jgi:hypothetical protein
VNTDNLNLLVTKPADEFAAVALEPTTPVLTDETNEPEYAPRHLFDASVLEKPEPDTNYVGIAGLPIAEADEGDEEDDSDDEDFEEEDEDEDDFDEDDEDESEDEDL